MTTALNLSPRQRAILAEMGVRVWLPQPAPPASPALGAGVGLQSKPKDPLAQRPLAPTERALATSLHPPLRDVGRTRLEGTRPEPVRRPVPPPAASSPSSMPSAAHATRYVIDNMPQALEQPLDYLVVGEPCTGAAAQLLNNMLRMLGDRLWVAQMVAARADQPSLEAQLPLVSVKAVLVLGPHAAKAVLGASAHPVTFGQLRGQSHRLELPGQTQSVPVIVTYHPLQLLRQPLAKAKAWQDLKRLLELGRQLR